MIIQGMHSFLFGAFFFIKTIQSFFFRFSSEMSSIISRENEFQRIVQKRKKIVFSVFLFLQRDMLYVKRSGATTHKPRLCRQ